MMTAAELIEFERDVADIFNAGKIRAPVHLAGGNEDDLIAIFKGIADKDWVCGAWRMHYHCLLKGVPREQLLADIKAGRSITLCYPEQRIITSAIVGGVLPIALGIAWSIKRNGGSNRVWAFAGDMTAETGIYNECVRYAAGHGLPIRFVVEDNGRSVCTDTRKVWGSGRFWGSGFVQQYYGYELPFPHAGAGKRVQF